MRAMRVVIHLGDGAREILDAAEIYHLEAVGDQTRVRLRRRRARLDVRALGTVIDRWARLGFVRIHRSHAVNLAAIHLLRRRELGRDWEVKLEPPITQVLPVSREALGPLIAALEGEE